MKLIRLDQQLKCIFCQKSQQGVKKLIASPDHHTYICDDCTVERGRLRLGSDNALTVSFRCSFCRKRQCFLGFYVSPLKGEIRAQICGECLDVCRQIIKDEAKEHSVKS